MVWCAMCIIKQPEFLRLVLQLREQSKLSWNSQCNYFTVNLHNTSFHEVSTDGFREKSSFLRCPQRASFQFY